MTEKFKTNIRMLPQLGPLEVKAADKPGTAGKRVLLNRCSATGAGEPKRRLLVRGTLRALISCALAGEEDGRQGIPLLCDLIGNSAQQRGRLLPALKGEVSGAEKIFDDRQNI